MDTKVSQTFAEPAPLGLLGLAVGCAALLPVAFGCVPHDPAAAAAMLETCAWMCLLFGAGCQLLAGVMALANKNALGGTLFTTFAFNWAMNFWALDRMAHGKAVDASVIACADVTFLVIFVVLTFAFALVSKVLFLFLLDVDVLYALRLAGHPRGVALATVGLAAIALYLALATLLNEAAGRALLPIGGPLLKTTARAPLRASSSADPAGDLRFAP